jgi:hypothetical protein
MSMGMMMLPGGRGLPALQADRRQHGATRTVASGDGCPGETAAVCPARARQVGQAVCGAGRKGELEGGVS